MRELWRRLWSRIRPAERRSQHTDGVTLTAQQFNAASSGVLEELHAIDTLTPSGPVLPTWIPTEVEMQLWIKAYLQDCPEMFDEGTLDFLAPYLRSQEQLWLRASAVAENAALTSAHRIRSVNDGHLQVARARLAQLSEIETYLAHAISHLNGRLNPEGVDHHGRPDHP